MQKPGMESGLGLPKQVCSHCQQEKSAFEIFLSCTRCGKRICRSCQRTGPFPYIGTYCPTCLPLVKEKARKEQEKERERWTIKPIQNLEDIGGLTVARNEAADIADHAPRRLKPTHERLPGIGTVTLKDTLLIALALIGGFTVLSTLTEYSLERILLALFAFTASWGIFALALGWFYEPRFPEGSIAHTIFLLVIPLGAGFFLAALVGINTLKSPVSEKIIATIQEKGIGFVVALTGIVFSYIGSYIAWKTVGVHVASLLNMLSSKRTKKEP